MEMEMDDKKHELECAMSDIRRVESLKANKPELYNKAVMGLKKEAKAIGSLAELKGVAKEKMESDDE